MQQAVIVSALRTPVGSFGKSLASVPAVDLGVLVLKETLKRMQLDPGQIDEVILGNVLQAGLGQIPHVKWRFMPGFPRKLLRSLSIRSALPA